jgi:hypothetical protein
LEVRLQRIFSGEISQILKKEPTFPKERKLEIFGLLSYELRHCTVSYVVTNVLESPAASIFGVEETLKIEATGSSETLVSAYQTVQCHNFIVHNPYLYHRENLEFS